MSGQGEQVRLRQLKGGLTAGVLIAAAVAVAFGTGFTASRTLLGEGGAWLSKGTTVAHVNSGTARHDATVDEDITERPGDQEVVPTPDGSAVVDEGDGTVTTVDTDSMTTGPEASLRGDGELRFVVAGRFGYLVRDTVVQPVDAVSLEHRGSPIEVGHVGGAVATSEGTLVVLDAEKGRVVEIVDGDAELPVEVASRPGRRHLTMTAVSGRPVVIDTRAGTVRRLRPGPDPEDPIRVEGLGGVTVDQLAVADPHADGSTLWLVRKHDGRLVGVDLDRRSVRSGLLDERGDTLGSPVVLEGLVYVPHGQSRQVSVVDGRGDQPHRIDRHEPAGSGTNLEVFVQDRRVWINDPAAQHALVVEPNGRDHRVVDKGTGHGVEDDTNRRPGDDAGRPGTGVPQPGPGPAAPAPSPAPAAVPSRPAAAPSPAPAQPPAPPPMTDVPRVVGENRTDACNRILEAQLRCDARPVADAPRGTRREEVLSQDPSGGEAPILSAVIVEFYSPDPVRVDDFTGQRVLGSATDPQNGPACQAVKQQGFTCDPREVPPAADTPADAVLPATQRPQAGTEQVPGEPVSFQYQSTAFVPNVVTMTQSQACDALAVVNLQCNPVAQTIGATPGQVVAQDPVATTPAAAGTQVNVHIPQRQPVVPNLVGMSEAQVRAALEAEGLTYGWLPNPNHSIRNPNLADHQAYPVGTSLPPGTQVVAYHPSAPDVTLYRYRARRNGQLLEQWALAPNGGPGRAIYDELAGRANAWPSEGAVVGSCYSTEVAGSVLLYDFVRPSGDDSRHEDHFYTTPHNGSSPDSQWKRAHDHYPPNPRPLCYVIPWDGAAGARHVFERYKDGTPDSHMYTLGGEPDPSAGYITVNGHWMTW